MANLVEKERMRILVTGLNKGFTILEILIVLAIISISGTSFYLILNQPKYFDSYEQIFNEYKKYLEDNKDFVIQKLPELPEKIKKLKEKKLTKLWVNDFLFNEPEILMNKFNENNINYGFARGWQNNIGR